MAEYLIQSGTLDDIVDAINAKTGGSSAMTPAQMVQAIGTISGGSSTTKTTYTQTESRENDTLGNVAAFRNAYLPATLEDGVYFVNITNNSNNSGYRAISLFVVNNLFNQHMYCMAIRGTGSVSLIGSVDYFNSSTSFYTSANSVIDVYFAPKGVIIS